MNAEKFSAVLRANIFSSRSRRAWADGLSVKEAYKRPDIPNVVFVKLSDKTKWRITVVQVEEEPEHI